MLKIFLWPLDLSFFGILLILSWSSRGLYPNRIWCYLYLLPIKSRKPRDQPFPSHFQSLFFQSYEPSSHSPFILKCICLVFRYSALVGACCGFALSDFP